MKMINFAFRIILIIVFINIIFTQIGRCGSGGGSGDPYTPYKKNEEITEKRVSYIRSISSSKRDAKFSYGDGKRLKHFLFVGFIYLENEDKHQYKVEIKNLPKDFEFDNFKVTRIRFEKPEKQFIFSGLMTFKERDILIKNFSELTIDSQFKKQLINMVWKFFHVPRLTTDIFHYLEGSTTEGKIQRIYLSDIENIKILERNKEKVYIEIDNFPNISPKKLLTIKPSYTELRKNYSKTVKLWVNCVNKKGEELYIVSTEQKDLHIYQGFQKSWYSGNEYYIRSRQKFINLIIDQWINIGYPELISNEIWWAIPSVIKDFRYPYREIITY